MTTIDGVSKWIVKFLLEFFQPGVAIMILSAARQKIEVGQTAKKL